jgi:hypothetical protein
MADRARRTLQAMQEETERLKLMLEPSRPPLVGWRGLEGWPDELRSMSPEEVERRGDELAAFVEGVARQFHEDLGPVRVAMWQLKELAEEMEGES